MTAEEKIAEIGTRQKERELSEENEKEKEMRDLLNRVLSFHSRAKVLIDLARKCKANDINLKGKIDEMYSEGIESKNFMSDGWSHYLGFNNELNAIGFYNGGAFGPDDTFLTYGGELKFPIRRENAVRDFKKFIRDFDKFEKAFYEYIDELYEKG